MTAKPVNQLCPLERVGKEKWALAEAMSSSNDTIIKLG